MFNSDDESFNGDDDDENRDSENSQEEEDDDDDEEENGDGEEENENKVNNETKQNGFTFKKSFETQKPGGDSFILSLDGLSIKARPTGSLKTFVDNPTEVNFKNITENQVNEFINSNQVRQSLLLP